MAMPQAMPVQTGPSGSANFPDTGPACAAKAGANAADVRLAGARPGVGL